LHRIVRRRVAGCEERPEGFAARTVQRAARVRMPMPLPAGARFLAGRAGQGRTRSLAATC
jgi:hypothetical protein